MLKGKKRAFLSTQEGPYLYATCGERVARGEKDKQHKGRRKEDEIT